MQTRINDGIAENEFCDINDKGNNSPAWSNLDFAIRFLVPDSIGHGVKRLSRFKTAFVRHNRMTIIAAAHEYRLPPELLAGVAWIESGGKPNTWKSMIYASRMLIEHEIGQGHLKAANKTSFGFMSMQIRAAAETLGLDSSTLDLAKQQQLAACLETDTYVIRLAAKHLRMLADHDGFDLIGIEEARIVATRYNYGTERTLAQLKTDLKYGNFIIDRWHSYSIMLGTTR